MEVTERLMEKEWKARLAESERELRQQVDEALGAKQTEEEKRKRLEEIVRSRTKDVLEAVATAATVMWTFVPKLQRDGVVDATKRDRVKQLLNTAFLALSEAGPSPADRRLPAGYPAHLAEGPPPVPPPSQRTAQSLPTDVTPGTPEDPGVETATSS
jgi:hypothetical protein